MIFDYETLKFIWWILVGALLIGFAITDGMDMGVGNLLPFIGRTDDERQVVLNSVSSHWEGNQVWLVTAAGAVFAAWPDVYAAAFSGFYMAMLLVLFALFFRPVGFDYRSKIADPRWRRTWDWALFAGGAIPALIFGVAFGNLLLGVPFHFDDMMRAHYEGSLLSALLPLLNPFALLAGVISFAMLTMHGGIWLQLRTEPPIAERVKTAITLMGLVAVVGFALGGLWIAYGIDGYRVVSQPALGALPDPLAKSVVMARGAWLDIYAKVPLAMLAPAAGFLGLLLGMALSRLNRPGWGFVASSLGVAGIIGTAGLSLFPFIMPSSTNPESGLTIWDAPSSHLTLSVMFWAVVIFLPLVLAYTIWCYAHMWGKSTIEDIQAHGRSGY